MTIRNDNQAYQGGIRKALKQVCQERRFRWLEEGGSKRGRAWEKAREKGDTANQVAHQVVF